MPKKISQLTSATDVTASDLIQIVDVEDGVMAPSGTNKKATAQLVANNLAKIITDGAIVSADTSTNAVSITQTGNGNSLIVNDSSPDSSPFVIDSTGRTIIGESSAVNVGGNAGFEGLQVIGLGQSIIRSSENSGGPALSFAKNRGSSSSTNTAVESGDGIGSVLFQGATGSGFATAGQIRLTGGGAFSSTSSPGIMILSTTPVDSVTTQERMRITSAGSVAIGVNSPSSKLHVDGDLTVSSATTASSATAGTSGDVPAQVEGYLVVRINGTARKIPYYA